MLRSIDLRQMEGEPGFFGSYGFSGWAGVGEAKPIGVIHELSHSYWGGFPVTGQPDLNWESAPGGAKSTAMQAYHQDILTFMAQPPDDYEILRQRLRNLPDVSIDNPEPIFHHLEADVPYTTGGSLNLMPPILRKYWDNFLQDGRFEEWYGAAGWFQSLTHDEKTAAGKWLGFEHLDLRQYPSLTPGTTPDEVLATAAHIFTTEEQERLRDLVFQFDLLIGDPQKEENFDFWRNYLRDKVNLYKAHPSYLTILSHPRARDLTSALKFLAETPSGTPKDQAQRLANQLTAEPILVNFLPAVGNQVLVELFSSGTPLPQGKTLQATASFVERLKVFGGKVDEVLENGRVNPTKGTSKLEIFISETNLEQTDDLKLFFDLLRDRDFESAKTVVVGLSNQTVRDLMVPIPFQLRAILSPSELLPKLGIAPDISTSANEVRDGINLLIDEPSGNYRIDEPFLDALHQVVAERTERDAQETAQMLSDSRFPFEGFILAQPTSAANLFEVDMEVSLSLIRKSDPLLSPPARIIYRLISANPHRAAELLAEFHRRGETKLVSESLAYIAYDKDRSERSRFLPISLERDGEFLGQLLANHGSNWLQARLNESVKLVQRNVANDEISLNFLNHYRETLEFAATLTNRESAKELTTIISMAFRPF